MNQDVDKHVLIGLTKIVREQHLQINRLLTAVGIIREHLGPAVDAKIDRTMRDNLALIADYGPSADETLQLLDRIIEQLQKR